MLYVNKLLCVHISIYVNIYGCVHAHIIQSFQLGKEGKYNTESIMNLIEVNSGDKKRKKMYD